MGKRWHPYRVCQRGPARPWPRTWCSVVECETCLEWEDRKVTVSKDPMVQIFGMCKTYEENTWGPCRCCGLVGGWLKSLGELFVFCRECFWREGCAIERCCFNIVYGLSRFSVPSNRVKEVVYPFDDRSGLEYSPSSRRIFVVGFSISCCVAE